MKILYQDSLLTFIVLFYTFIFELTRILKTASRFVSLELSTVPVKAKRRIFKVIDK